MKAEMNSVEAMFSIIITNYNYAMFLKHCIESALSQDYQKFEVIVVDDGSKDDSRALIESFGDRIRSVFKQNGGTISSLNSGWLQARGEFILFLDADDFLLPGALSVHAKALSEAGVVRSQGYQLVVDSKGKSTGTRYPPRRPQSEGLLNVVLRFGPSGYISTATSGNAWAKSFLDKVYPLPETRTSGGDALLFDVAPLYGQTVTVDATVASYRLHSGGFASQRLSMVRGGKPKFTIETISAVLNSYEFRAKRIQATAASLGYEAQVTRWSSRNWRISTVRFLRSRLSRKMDKPSLAEHLTAAAHCQSLSKRILVVGAVLAMRVSPTPISVAIASKMMNLHEM